VNCNPSTVSHFRNQKKEYLEDRMNNIAANSKKKNIANIGRNIN
jgi:hypothetical protein